MSDIEPPVVAENGTLVEVGGVYLTFSGDPDEPYSFAKVIRIGEPSPNSPLLWLLIHRDQWAQPPAAPSGPSTVIQINVAVFLGWGPPKFPIRVGTEAVTPDELAAASPKEGSK